MPNLESVRRIIGRDIIQKYVTDGDDSMIETGSFPGGTGSKNLGFKPKLVIAMITDSVYGELSTFIASEEMQLRMYDFTIRDYSNRDRRVMRQTLRDEVYRNILITSTGFDYDWDSGTGYYIAIG